MKKLTTRDISLLAIIGVLGVVFIYYSYIFSPIKEAYDIVYQEKMELKAQVEYENVESEKKYLEKLQKDLTLIKEELKETESTKILTKEQQDTLLKHIGEQANKFDINLIKFEEKEVNKTLSYNILPYDIKARGTSKDLVLFVNSLYGLFDFFQIENLYLRKVEVMTTTKKIEATTEETETEMNFNWSEDYLDLLHLEIPKIKEKTTQSNKQAADEVSEESVETALQLDFVLNFLSAK